MTYESPKQIRRRQNAANDNATRPRRQRKTKSELEQQRAWESQREYHIRGAHGIYGGTVESIGRHAQALVHALMQLRATEIMRERNCDYLTAAPYAREDLYNCEAA